MGSEKLPEGGRKDDAGKLRMDLIPGYPLMRLAEVYTIGARKYADENWRAGISYKRIFGALMRHAWKWFMGETFDPDGQHHLSSVAWCAFTLMEYEIIKPEFDDRPMGADHNSSPVPKKKPTTSEEEVGQFKPGGTIGVTAAEMKQLQSGIGIAEVLRARAIPVAKMGLIGSKPPDEQLWAAQLGIPLPAPCVR